MSLKEEQIIDKLERKIDEQSEQIAKINDTLTRVVDLNFPPGKMTKALSKGSCSDFCTTLYWVQSL